MSDMESFIRQLSNQNTAKTFAFNSSEAQKSRDYQTMMSNTSHQREVEDLKKAGLNPVLSSNGGAQAYSASSASGTADNSAVGVLASLYQTKMNNDNARQIARMQNANNVQIAKINAAASNYASNNSYAASRYATDQSYAGHVYSTDRTKYGMAYNAYQGFTNNSARSSGSKLRSTVEKVWNDFKTTSLGKAMVKSHNKFWK